jgi:hypothetical protein
MKSLPDWKLWLAGEGDISKQLQDFAIKNNLESPCSVPRLGKAGRPACTPAKSQVRYQSKGEGKSQRLLFTSE